MSHFGLKGSNHEENRFRSGHSVGFGPRFAVVGSAGARRRWCDDRHHRRGGLGMVPPDLRSAARYSALRLARSLARVLACRLCPSAARQVTFSTKAARFPRRLVRKSTGATQATCLRGARLLFGPALFWRDLEHCGNAPANFLLARLDRHLRPRSRICRHPHRHRPRHIGNVFRR